MLRITETEVMNLRNAIRAMRNPLNSWAQSDTDPTMARENKVGPKDWDLMVRLRNSGSDHRKFMRSILVSVDFEAPMYWWKEWDTYKVGTVRNSCSTMHTIQKTPLTIDLMSHEHLNPDSIKAMEDLLAVAEKYRQIFNETNDKNAWWQMIQLLPSSANQKATITTNYEQLANAYHSRKNHKQDEWRITFCEWVKSLPLSYLITGEEEDLEKQG